MLYSRHETHFLFQEANEIAEELEKFLSFELCLVNKGGPGADVPSSGAEGGVAAGYAFLSSPLPV